VTETSPSRWSKSPEHPNSWVAPADDPRYSGTDLTDERSTLLDYLDAYRLTLEMKCADLDAEQLARRSVPPSTLSLLGLVRHMADVERGWFRRTMAGEDVPRRWVREGGRDDAFDQATGDPAQVAEAWEAWNNEVAFARDYVANADLEVRGTMRDGTQLQLREVIVHMIEEYARHCGHADLIRERIDGRVGG